MAKYIKGLFKDTSPGDQPQGTWRYAKNIVMHPRDGAISTELGIYPASGKPGQQIYTPYGSKAGLEGASIFNSQGGLISRNYPVVIGSIEITDDRVILFVVYDLDLMQHFVDLGTGTNQQIAAYNNILNGGEPRYKYEILEWDGQILTILYRPRLFSEDILDPTDLDLNFNKNYFIEGTYKKNPEGELFIYWTDDLNPPRVMNVTRQKKWLKDGIIKSGPNAGQAPQFPEEYLYGIDWETTPNPIHKDMLNLFPSSGPVPQIQLDSINPGGGLLTGVYYLALAYVDQDLVQTNYVTIANPISIVEDVEGVLPIERYDGAPPKVPSGKSITWGIKNVNTDYEYVRPAVIRKSGGATQAFKLNDIPIANLLEENAKLVFTGLEGYSEFSVEDIIVDTVFYDTAKTINQLDGVLYLGNVKGTRDLGYQKYANHIKLCPELKNFNPFDPHEVTQDVLDNNYIATDPYGEGYSRDENPIRNGYRWNENIFTFKGYTRDEVYAFYIAFIMNDGTESYAYHIPGRAPLKFGSDGEQASKVPAWNSYGNSSDANANLFEGTFGQFESYDLARSNPLNQTSDWKGRIFHFYETSMLDGANNMNFWQNMNELYPSDELNKDNWEVWDAGAEWANPSTYNGEVDENGSLVSLSGKRVRHHHFPSNENLDYQIFAENQPEDDMEIESLGNMWFALDFQSCTSRVDQSGITVDDMLDEAGVNDEDLTTYVDDDDFTGDDVVDYANYLEGPGSDGDIICFRRPPSGGSESDGASWPEIGDSVNYAFQKNSNDDNVTRVRLVGSYTTAMYDPTGGEFPEVGDTPWPGNWGPCSGYEGDVYVQGGFHYTDLQHNTGGPYEDGSYGCNDANQARYWPWGCLRHHNAALVSGDGYQNNRAEGKVGCSGLDSTPCHRSDEDTSNCDDWADPIVLWANNTGTDNLLILDTDGGAYAATADGFDTDRCDGMVWWKKDNTIVEGTVNQDVRALGFSLHDLKVPKEIAEKTQGFRIYYAKREHQDRRILGQNIFHPQAPTLEPTYPTCASTASLGLDSEDEALDSGYVLPANSMYTGDGINKENYWINFPYTLPANAFESVFEARGSSSLEYQCFTFHDFYLMRTRKTITAATHIKVEYGLEVLPWAGPGFRHDCSGDPEGDSWSWNSDDNQSGSQQFAGREDCFAMCIDDPSMTLGYQIGLTYYNATQMQNAVAPGGAGGAQLYNWFGDFWTDCTNDLNKSIKERCKTYVHGDSVFNGKQLGFGFKNYNEFGESHIALLLNSSHGIIPAWPNTGDSPTAQSPGVAHNYGVGAPIKVQVAGGKKQFFYQGNLHAFRLDMYNSIDTQDLVWTGFQVVGEAYKGFTVPYEEGNTYITHNGESAYMGDNDKYDTKKVFAFFEEDNWNGSEHPITKLNQDGKIFGGDTYICRYGYRKTLRPGLDGGSGAFHPNVADYLGRDMRFVYETVVESTDNINFRHIESKKDSYWPGTSVKDVLELDNLIDLTDVDNIKYNEDYSAVNDIGHTVPLPLQISQPTDFPTRVVRSAQTDDTSLVDSYRVFLANQFKDLPKNRGDLWKISVFNNLLYFHMEDTILRTKGKQNLQLADKSEAFVGSGDIFAQAPDELVQTDSGFGGTQSQWATAISKYGYFYLDQRARAIYLITDQINNISSLGMEKWFQENIPFAIEHLTSNKAPKDNPYLFGFVATWDDSYQRFILTKRELIPTDHFRRMMIEKMIYFDVEKEVYFIESEENAGDWMELKYSYLPQGHFDDDNGKPHFSYGRYFTPTGWSISYNPELNIWVSFHDDLSYLYTYIGSNLYSFADFPYTWQVPKYARFWHAPSASDLNAQYNAAGVAPEDNEILDSGDDTPSLIGHKPFDISHWVGDRIWHHHRDLFPTPNPETYAIVGDRFDHLYTSEFEVIHNEANDLNKLFYNFSYDMEQMCEEAVPSSLINNTDHYHEGDANLNIYNSISNTEQKGPGFDLFVVYNSHQCSGYRRFAWDHTGVADPNLLPPNSPQQMLNYSYWSATRQNGSDWSVRHFRDIIKLNIPITETLGIGIEEGGILPFAGATVPNTSQSLLTENSLPIWLTTGMTEILNRDILDIEYNPLEPTRYKYKNKRKFVDKWIALRLICLQSRNIVNLLSTKVGIRKYHRHEQK